MSDHSVMSTEAAPQSLVWDYARARQPVRILLAGSEPDLRELLAHRFRTLGYDVIEAEDGRELLEEFADWEPQLVIANLELRHIDALDALARLRRLNHDTPFIVISPKPDPEVRSRAARLGASLVHERPIDMQQLISNVWSIVGP